LHFWWGGREGKRPPFCFSREFAYEGQKKGTFEHLISDSASRGFLEQLEMARKQSSPAENETAANGGGKGGKKPFSFGRQDPKNERRKKKPRSEPKRKGSRSTQKRRASSIRESGIQKERCKDNEGGVENRR